LPEAFLKIRAQFITGIIFIIITAIAATTYVHVTDAEQMLMQSIDDRGTLIINYLSGVVVDPLLKKDELQLSYYLKKVSNTPGILYLLIADKNSVIVASNNVSDIGRDVIRTYGNITIGIGWSGKIIDLNYNGRAIKVKNFVESIDVKNEGIKVSAGTIYVGFDMQLIDSEIMNIYLKNGIIGVLVIIFSMFLAMFLTGSIIKPLHQLMEGTEIVASGNLRYKIKVKVKNEFQALANSFNEMTEKLNDYYDGVLNAFTIALDSKDKYSPGHSKRVAQFAMELGKKLNMTARQIENIRIAAILKDIGNISVENSIFTKKEALSPDDILKIQKHPEVSAKILKNIHQLKDVIPIILQHHERYDGLGYPNGLRGNDILKEAKILSITDAYDAMITPREHREAIPVEECIYELRSNKGKQFDPEITEAFIEILNRKGGT
jgi:HAMP domain-containing protein